MKIAEKQLRKYISESIKNVLNESYNDAYTSGLLLYQGTGSPESKNRVDKILKKTHNVNAYTEPGNVNKGNDSVYDHTLKSFGGKHAKHGGEIVQPLMDYCKKLKETNDEGLKQLAEKIQLAIFNWEREHENFFKHIHRNLDAKKQAVAESVDKAFNKVLNEMHYSDFKALGQGGPVSDYTEVLKRYQFSPDLDFESIDLNQFRNISKGSQAFFYISILAPDGKMWQSNITTRSERKAFHMAQRITDDLQKTNWLESLKSAGLLDDNEGYGFIEIGYVDGAYLNGMEVDTDCCGSYNYDAEEDFCFWND